MCRIPFGRFLKRLVRIAVLIILYIPGTSNKPGRYAARGSYSRWKEGHQFKKKDDGLREQAEFIQQKIAAP
jgi:hypothetical protein